MPVGLRCSTFNGSRMWVGSGGCGYGCSGCAGVGVRVLAAVQVNWIWAKCCHWRLSKVVCSAVCVCVCVSEWIGGKCKSNGCKCLFNDTWSHSVSLSICAGSESWQLAAGRLGTSLKNPSLTTISAVFKRLPCLKLFKHHELLSDFVHVILKVFKLHFDNSTLPLRV